MVIKQLIRYFTLRRRVKKMLISSVYNEYEWTRLSKGLNGINNHKEICKKRVDEYAFLSQKLMELL